jgi:hypothetical protein
MIEQQLKTPTDVLEDCARLFVTMRADLKATREKLGSTSWLGDIADELTRVKELFIQCCIDKTDLNKLELMVDSLHRAAFTFHSHSFKDVLTNQVVRIESPVFKLEQEKHETSIRVNIKALN